MRFLYADMGPIEDAQSQEPSPTPTAASEPVDSSEPSSEGAPNVQGESTSPMSIEIPSTTPAPTPKPTPAPTPPSTPAPSVPTPSVPAPTPTPEPTLNPAFTARVDIPAQEESSGGEWQILIEKVKETFGGSTLQDTWQQLRLPVRLVGGLIILIITLRIYQGLLDTIDRLPLAPGLLELAGLIWLVKYMLINLVRSTERKKVFDQIRSSWKSVTGR